MNPTTFDQKLEVHPYRTILSIAWPQILMMVFHFLIGFVDVWVAGRLGKEVQATMGVITQALFFFMVVAIAIANGSVAAISQSMGAGLEKRIKRYVGLCLQTGGALSAFILIAGLLVKDSLLFLLQIPGEIESIAAYILGVFLYVLPFYYLFIISNGIFRAQKMVMIPLYSMAIVTLLNTFGDLAFGLGMFGMPHFGYKGLAWSTFGSVLAGTVFNLAILRRTGLLTRNSFAPWRWIKKAWPYLYKVAWPAGLMQIVWHSAYLALYAIIGSLPQGSVVALAGMSAGIRVESLLFLPGFAFNFTASILVGHYLGQRKPVQAKKIGYQILGMGFVSISILTFLVWQVIEPITVFIAPDPSVQAESINYLIYNMAGIPFLLTAMILGGAFTGAGATFYQMIVFGVAAWGIRVPLAYLLGHVVFSGSTGIWAAMLISMMIQAMIMLYAYQTKNWQGFAMRGERDKCVRAAQPEGVIPRK